ncbi:MAG: hypothetical protein KF727_01640 [Microbacteriaceae bacterium]|nr:hypothetical protein [Microbacteriaceae bacterium]
MTPTLETATLPGADVAAFAAAVRAALADLPPDELDELTDGLEADLTERAADSGETGDGADLGDPAAYADELRAAAGYPPRTARSHAGGLGIVPALRDVRGMLRGAREGWTAFLARHRILAGLVEFLVSLRPVWWVFRGWVIGIWIANAVFGGWMPLPATQLGWIAMLATIVVSVMFGRGRWLPRQWMRRALAALNVVVIAASPFVLGWLGNQLNNMGYAYYYGSGETYYPESLNLGGRQIDNIFAYDADGTPIDQVQLFDQDGNPLNLVVDTSAPFWGTVNGEMVVPSGDVAGRAGWNVYPLAHVNDWSDFEDDGAIDPTEVSDTAFPSASVKPLAGNPVPSTAAQGAAQEGAASEDATQEGADADPAD